MLKKLPYINFFVNDWLADIQLHQCSVEARGVWIDLLCLMTKSTRYGFLLNGNGRPFTMEQLALSLRIGQPKLVSCIAELEAEGVFSRDEHGVIFSRRLIRDMERISTAREGTRERVQRFRERERERSSSPKHSCESPRSPQNPWDYFVRKGHGKDEFDWDKAGRPTAGEIASYEAGEQPWPQGYPWRTT
jgi:hypothetical protein